MYIDIHIIRSCWYGRFPILLIIDVKIGELYKWRWDITDLYHRGHGERGERAVEHLHITHCTLHITHYT